MNTLPTTRAVFQATTPPAIGQHWPGQGGVYIGICNSGPGQKPQHIIVATAPEADFTGVWGEYGQDVPDAKDRFNGRANTAAMAESGSEIAQRVLALQIDGHKDFHIPSRAEAALAEANTSKLFNDDWHWTSTQGSRSSAFVQDFEDGDSGSLWVTKVGERRVRAFRGLPLEPLNTLAEGHDAKIQPIAGFTASDIDCLMTQAFAPGRDPRSTQYRQGVQVIIAHRLAGEPIPALPYTLGSCEADAYFAGHHEGHAIAARVNNELAGAA